MHLVVSAVLLIGLTVLGVGAELIAVVQLFRHGQRTPGSFYTNDPYKDLSAYWGGLDYGQLTNEGKRQHFALGQYTRSRYSSFLPEKYNRSVVYVQTTDVDRTHMSAQSNLYGIYPAKSSDQIWRKNVDWQAIPIHPADSDVWSSAFFLTDCEAYTTLLANVLNSEEYQEIDSNYSEMYSYLTKNSGNNITDFTGTNTIWDSVKIEDAVGYSLPSWTKSVYPEPLRTLAGLIFELSTHTTQMKRFITGPFFNEVLEYLESMAENPDSSQKFRIYSGHDTNIAATLNSLGAFDPPYPPAFASSIYIELHVESWRNVVKVFSKDGDTVTQISVNGCDLSCPLSEFREKLSDIIVNVTTRASECTQVVESTTSSTKLLSLNTVQKSQKYSPENLIEEWRDFSN